MKTLNDLMYLLNKIDFEYYKKVMMMKSLIILEEN